MDYGYDIDAVDFEVLQFFDVCGFKADKFVLADLTCDSLQTDSIRVSDFL